MKNWNLGILVLAVFALGAITGRSGWPMFEKRPAPQHLADQNIGEIIDPISVVQNGNRISILDLISIFKSNPVRFTQQTRNSRFEVSGIIQRIGDKTGLEDVSGFHIPIRPPMGDQLDEVALWVKGMSDTELAALNPGRKIRVACLGVRAFNKTLIFDDCKVAEGRSK